MSDPRIRTLKIKTGVVKRLSKEKVTYEKEASQQKEKIIKYKEQEKDEHLIKKQEEVLQESLMMIPDCQRRLLKAFEDLKKYIESTEDLKDTEEFAEAEKILKESEAEMNENMEAHCDDICMDFSRDNCEIQKNVNISETRFISISTYKNSILHTHGMLEHLKYLKNNIIKCDTTTNLNDSIKLYLDLKQRIQESLSRLENEISQNIKKYLKQYKQRILKRKRKKKSWQIQKEHSKERRKMLELCINECIKANQDRVLLQKKKESARRNADIILSDIRSKRADCRKFTTILQEMDIFRKAKMNIVKGGNDSTHLEAYGAFHNKISELKKKWEKLAEIYLSEENVLKSKIKSKDNIYSDDVKNSHFNWETGLLGMRLSGTNYGDYNWTTMKTTRKAWDSFISNDGFELPTGWVVPCEPSNPAWNKYIEVNASH